MPFRPFWLQQPHVAHNLFLAAMSSSRVDIVTQSVFLSVCLSPFFSFSVLEVLSSPKEFQWCFKKVLRVLEVSKVVQGGSFK